MSLVDSQATAVFVAAGIDGHLTSVRLFFSLLFHEMTNNVDTQAMLHALGSRPPTPTNLSLLTLSACFDAQGSPLFSDINRISINLALRTYRTIQRYSRAKRLEGGTDLPV